VTWTCKRAVCGSRIFKGLTYTFLQRFLIVALVCGSWTNAQAEDWPTFRGEDRDGVSGEQNLLDSWEEGGPKLVWTTTGAGRGYASPAVSDGRIYTLGDGPSTAQDQDEYLTCFAAADGKQLWMTKTGEPWNEGKASWQGSRSTPTVDGDRVFVITPFGKLLCVRALDGAKVWERHLKEDLGGSKKDQWGYSESPLVDGEKLLCTPGGDKATVVALNKATGEIIWSCVRPGDVGAGHSSIVITHVGGKKVYVQNTGGGPMGIDAESGQLLWSYDMAPPTAFIPTPVIKDDYVFSVAGYKLGGALLQQIPGPGGAVAVKEIYGVKTELGNKHGGVVRIGNYLYAGAEDQAIIYCADMMTGEVQWKERGSGSNSAAITAADGKLFVRYQNGVMALAKIDPTSYSEISTFQTPGSGDSNKPSWAHPVVANGQLLLREDDSIWCYDISKK
jgi:outer membrane protein assembly factor BamB